MKIQTSRKDKGMAGIVSYGAYIPIHRLSKNAITAFWGNSAKAGEKAVAGADEDTITLAVEASIDCLSERERQSIGGLYFASTTPPFQEKQCASIVAAAVDLGEQIHTCDFANSLRAGTSALNAGFDAIKSGTAQELLVVAADCRLPAPNCEQELLFGDGAAAILLGNSDVAVEVEASLTRSSAFIDSWRTEKDTYPRSWEDRFVLDEGYLKILPMAVSALLEQCGLEIKDFDKVVFCAPDARSHSRMARLIGAAKTQVLAPPFDELGHTGTALGLMMLVNALEEAKTGERILFANYSDGADIYVFRVTGQIERIKQRRGIKKHLASKNMLPGYGKYLLYRDLLEWASDLRPPRRTALTTLWREHAAILSLHGHKCKVCAGIQYPKRKVCQYCRAKDNFEDIRLSDKKGKLFTFSMDHRALEIDLPKVLAVVDIDGGGRFYTSLTDRDISKVEIDMPVEFTFRRIHEGSGIHNYFWKVRPIRC